MIPLSLRTNLDMAKVFYSIQIKRDKNIRVTVPRNSTIPEDLGRIYFLLTDKTGTLTKNEMKFKMLAMENEYYDISQIRTLLEILY